MRPKFTGFVDSFMLFDLEKGYESNLLVFELKTTAVDGILLYIGPEAAGGADFFALVLQNGRVKLLCRTDAGAETDTVMGLSMVNDGAWHRVSATRTSSKYSLQIDAATVVTATPSGPATLDTDSMVWLGAVGADVPLPTAIENLGVPRGLAACVAFFNFDGIELFTNQQTLARTSRVQHCETPRFNSSDFLGLGSAESSTELESLEVKFSFRVDTMANGTLFYQRSMDSSEFMKIALVNGLLALTVRTTSQVIEITTADEVSSGQWHAVTAAFSQGVTTLVYDGSTFLSTEGPNSPLILRQQHWFGGVQNSLLPGLQGCMRDIEINGQFTFGPSLDTSAMLFSPTVSACSV